MAGFVGCAATPPVSSCNIDGAASDPCTCAQVPVASSLQHQEPALLVSVVSIFPALHSPGTGLTRQADALVWSQQSLKWLIMQHATCGDSAQGFARLPCSCLQTHVYCGQSRVHRCCAGSVDTIIDASGRFAPAPCWRFTPTFVQKRLHMLMEAWGHRFLQLPCAETHFLHPRALDLEDKNGSCVMDLMENGFVHARQLHPHLKYAAFVESVVKVAWPMPDTPSEAPRHFERALTTVLMGMMRR